MSALDGWLDVFRAGTHRDSGGSTRAWTEADLDALVAAHRAGDPAPVVVGHPEHDAPAWGWVESMRRVGDRLQARLRDLDPAFRAAVEAGRYARRSVALAASGDGLRLQHLGFLGGAAPAVEGLAPTRFAAPATHTYTFAAPAPGAYAAWRTLARLLRSLRERIVAADGVAAADAALPEYDLETVAEAAQAPPAESTGAPRAAFGRTPAPASPPDPSDPDPSDSNPDPETIETMSGQTSPQTPDACAEAERLAGEAERLAAERAVFEAERAAHAAAQRRQSAETRVAAHVAAGRVLPGEAAGLAAFAAALPDDEAATFIFTAGDGDGEVRRTPRAYFETFLSGLPRRVDYREHSASGAAPQSPDPARDPQAVARAARALMAADASGTLTLDAAVRQVVQQPQGGTS